MVYDEGFDILIGDQSYFAFSMYTPRGRISGVPGGKKKWDSKCHATLNGWYHVGNKWGCFYALKQNVGDPYKPTNGEVEGKNIVLEGVIKSQDSNRADGPITGFNDLNNISNLITKIEQQRDDEMTMLPDEGINFMETNSKSKNKELLVMRSKAKSKSKLNLQR